LLCDAPGDPDTARSQLADSLRVLLHQRLLPRLNPPGCIAAFESLFGTAQLAQLIRQGDLPRLAALLDGPSTHDRISLDDALNELVQSAAISSEAMESVLAAARVQGEM
jgi:twitching motility protein PilT